MTAINGTGKTYFLKQRIKSFLKQGRVLIISQSDISGDWSDVKEIRDIDNPSNFKFDGVRKVSTARHDKNWLIEIMKHYRNGTIIFDDAGNYTTANIDHTKGLKTLNIDFRHLGLDLFYVYHSPRQVPPMIYNHAALVIIGKTTNMLPNNSSLSKADEIRTVQKEINRAFDNSEGFGSDKKRGIFQVIEL